MASKLIPSSSSIVDVLIIGAGPAGLACAAGLARLLHTTKVFSSNIFRNRKSSHMHTVATWDHQNPADFRHAARKDLLTRYNTVSFHDVSITKIVESKRDDGTTLFQATDENGKEWWGRKIVLATGVSDIMPNINGYEDCWARSIFHCLFCHGYEQRGSRSAGVLATDKTANSMFALHVARQALRLAEKVTVYTNGNQNLAREIFEANVNGNPNSMAKSRTNISVDSRIIQKLIQHSEVGLTIDFDDGEKIEEAFLVHQPNTQVNGDWANQLGLQLTEQGDLKVSAPFNETNVHGVFAAGDCAVMIKAVSTALSVGTLTAAGVGAQIQAED